MAKLTSKENFARLIVYLQEHGYSEDYIRAMKTEMRVVVRMQENGVWSTYREHYLRRLSSHPRICDVRKALSACWSSLMSVVYTLLDRESCLLS